MNYSRRVYAATATADQNYLFFDSAALKWIRLTNGAGFLSTSAFGRAVIVLIAHYRDRPLRPLGRGWERRYLPMAISGPFAYAGSNATINDTLTHKKVNKWVMARRIARRRAVIKPNWTQSKMMEIRDNGEDDLGALQK